MSFIPRARFAFSSRLMWYPGHQPKALKQLQKGIGHIDLVVEVRDARIPLSGRNAQFEEGLAGRRRVLVFNKSDLADEDLREKTRHAVNRDRVDDVDCLFCSVEDDKSVKRIIKYAVGMILDILLTWKICQKLIRKCTRRCQLCLLDYRMVCHCKACMIQVGKSSLMNRLRHVGLKKGKVAIVGPNAGVTRVIQTICESPAIYLVDTPGIFCPSVSDPIEGLKIALTGGTKDRLTDEYHVADYLLFKLNTSQKNIDAYTKLYDMQEPTNNVDELINAVAKKYGMEVFDGKRMRVNRVDCARRVVLDFRKGLLGRLTLDWLGAKVMEVDGEDIVERTSEDEFGVDCITYVLAPKIKADR